MFSVWVLATAVTHKSSYTSLLKCVFYIFCAQVKSRVCLANPLAGGPPSSGGTCLLGVAIINRTLLPRPLCLFASGVWEESDMESHVNQARSGTDYCLLHLSSQSLALWPNLELWAKYLIHELRKQQDQAPLPATPCPSESVSMHHTQSFLGTSEHFLEILPADSQAAGEDMESKRCLRHSVGLGTSARRESCMLRLIPDPTLCLLFMRDGVCPEAR